MPPDAIDEYGMTEACSQFYDDRCARRGERSAARQHAPSSRSRNARPALRKDGNRRWVDLANRLSFVLTEVSRGPSQGDDRPGAPFLLGRAEGLKRSCSLAAEEWSRVTS